MINILKENGVQHKTLFMASNLDTIFSIITDLRDTNI